MDKITPHLWFDGEAEEAANYYVSVFKNAGVTGKLHYGEAAAKVAGNACRFRADRNLPTGWPGIRRA